MTPAAGRARESAAPVELAVAADAADEAAELALLETELAAEAALLETEATPLAMALPALELADERRDWIELMTLGLVAVAASLLKLAATLLAELTMPVAAD